MAAEPKMAPFSELDSFVAKFRYLCSAGFNASLSLNAVGDGHARVSFEVDLGFLEPPMSVPPPISPIQPRRSPAYFRRLKKRKDSRQKLGTFDNGFTVANDSMDVTEKVIEDEEKAPVAIAVEDCKKCLTKVYNTEEVVEPLHGDVSNVSTCESAEAAAAEVNTELGNTQKCDAEEVKKLDAASHWSTLE